jgi:hypothetical protein
MAWKNFLVAFSRMVATIITKISVLSGHIVSKYYFIFQQFSQSTWPHNRKIIPLVLSGPRLHLWHDVRGRDLSEGAIHFVFSAAPLNWING